MHKNIGGDRPTRVCDTCGLVDDHPRHTIGADPGRDDRPGQDVIAIVLGSDHSPEIKALAVAQLVEPGLYRHLDCCRAVGCPDGTCNTQTAGAETLRGGALLTHLEGLVSE
ncbi:hypothetical protein GCM10010112_67850 [Actinoplanes lobatus]|uniref:Uncharacterized protein n=1 Tax=Actinoplanes lobatus TaxID=113568 RepID=A0A7W7HER3_9ACTN|nr:hypothetical protein [Actinoplanes lobatus]MBB4749135.1 hypothetical protein [Actinoplanes lobatus]GGN86366.1 hypothetical protein GCM10010112_67850 [Actinoplanes lobatus]GIE42767.1 hypothetical protein Alo02nite_56650 [Actinoplanes lobatus]